MSKDVALSKIEHGLPDGSLLIIEYGEPVDKLPKEVIEQLKAISSIGPEPMAASSALDEIEELKRQLAEAQAKLAEQTAPVVEPKRVDTEPAK